jgi:hypothetical protein
VYDVELWFDFVHIHNPHSFLSLSCMFCSVECLQWLVNHASGDPHMMAEDGMSPIHAAAQAGHIPCLTFLKSIGITLTLYLVCMTV